MPTTKVLHLSGNAPVTLPPGRGVVIASPVASGTTQCLLLDPNQGSGGNSNSFTGTVNTGTPVNAPLGRWLSRPLPAQSLAGMLWTLSFGQSFTVAPGSAITTTFDFALAQWRPSTASIIAYIISSTFTQTWGVGQASTNDYIGGGTVAGNAITLTAGDCLLMEIFARLNCVPASSIAAVTMASLFGGGTLYKNGQYVVSTLSDVDAVLEASAPITFY